MLCDDERMGSRHLFVGSGLLFLSVACSTSSPEAGGAKADAAATPSPSATPVIPDAAVPPSTDASNAADVVRHPTDKVLDHVPVIVKYANGAPVQTDVGAGKTILALKRGDKATAVGQYNGSKRILFADPKDASKTLTGWAQKFVFEDGFAGHPVPTCALNQMVVSDAASPLEPRCSTRCKTPADCHGAAKYCYDALVLMIEAGEDPPGNVPILSCGSDARLAAAPAAPTSSGAGHRGDAGAH